MLLAVVAIVVGFAVLMWSADKFVEGAAATAQHAGVPSILIGLVIVGFGTSAPEMVVSAIAAFDGSPDLALGNALGSNIVNTGLIIGVTAMITPLVVHSRIVRNELPLLIALGALLGYFLWDGALVFWEAAVLLCGFFVLVGWTIYSGLTNKSDSVTADIEEELAEHAMSLAMGIFWLVVGFVLLIVCSRVVVWGAVTVAQSLGVSDLVIGLTIVALGTSLPELAATVVAAKKGEHDIAIGNVVGSNMFNLLAVVGIAGVIEPLTSILPEVITRDWPLMMGLTIAMLLLTFGIGKRGQLGRFEGFLLLVAFIIYNSYLVYSIL